MRFWMHPLISLDFIRMTNFLTKILDLVFDKKLGFNFSWKLLEI